MSLYADYIKERTNDKIIESDFGFATYRHLPDQKATYIIDIYVKPELRLKGLASKFADQIAMEAREIGHLNLLGTVVPSARGSTSGIKTLIAYGMHLKSSTNDLIIFEKDLTKWER